MKLLQRYRLNELKKLKNVLIEYESLEELKRDLDSIITYREEVQSTGMNYQFNIDWWTKNNIFYPWDIELLRRNGITNLQELIDCDLDQLEGMTQSSKEVFEWARVFYDFRSIEGKKKYFK